VQYGLLIKVSQAIPRVLAGPPEGTVQRESAITPQSSSTFTSGIKEVLVDLEPELRMIPSADGSRSWTTIDLVVSVNTVKLHLYDDLATLETNVKDHGIARFALNDNTLRLKMLSDGAGEAQVVLKSFTMSNTRPGSSRFREIIPAAQHERNQFMLLFTMSGGKTGSALAILTVDSPQVLFAIDPVFALLQFFTSAFSDSPRISVDENVSQQELVASASQQPSVDFRIDLHDIAVSVLENDVDPDSQAIKLSIHQVLLSQQVGLLTFIAFQ
jgi:vacuolar protein sorting-associated protein 13A/C